MDPLQLCIHPKATILGRLRFDKMGQTEATIQVASDNNGLNGVS